MAVIEGSGKLTGWTKRPLQSKQPCVLSSSEGTSTAEKEKVIGGGAWPYIYIVDCTGK